MHIHIQRVYTGYTAGGGSAWVGLERGKRTVNRFSLSVDWTAPAGRHAEQEVYKQQEIRLASEPVRYGDCHLHHRADTVASGSTIPSDERRRRAWVSGETVISAHDTHQQLFYPTSSVLIR